MRRRLQLKGHTTNISNECSLLSVNRTAHIACEGTGLLTRESERQLIRKCTSSGRCGTMPLMQPADSHKHGTRPSLLTTPTALTEPLASESHIHNQSLPLPSVATSWTTPTGHTFSYCSESKDP